MSNRTSDLPIANTIAGSDRFVILSDPAGDPATETVSFDNLKRNLISIGTPLANSGVFVGQLWIDSNFLYINTSNNVIKKITLQTL